MTMIHTGNLSPSEVARREALAAAYPHLVAKWHKPQWSGHRLCAENIRRTLKKFYPSVKFSVTSKSFAGGDSVAAEWENGPTSRRVDMLIDKYSAGDFDGMNDSYTYRSDRLFTQVFGDAKYVHCRRGETLDAVRVAWEKKGFNPKEIPEKEEWNHPQWPYMRGVWSEYDFAEDRFIPDYSGLEKYCEKAAELGWITPSGLDRSYSSQSNQHSARQFLLELGIERL